MKSKGRKFALSLCCAMFAATLFAGAFALAERHEAYAAGEFFVAEESVTYDKTTVENWYGVPTTNQGEENFYVLYGKATGMYYEMTPNFGSDGDGNHWKGGAQYNAIDWRQDFSPDGGNDAIVAWRAPYNGKVKFQGQVHKDSMEGSDGIVLSAHMRNSLSDPVRKELFRKTYTEPFNVWFSGEEIEVQSGQIFFFSIGQNGNSSRDSTKLFLKAEFAQDGENPGTQATGGVIPTADAAPETCIFNNYPNYALEGQDQYYTAPLAQGNNNLFLLYGKANGVYNEMTTTQADGNHWSGGATYDGVWWRQEFAPDGGNDAIVAWRAPFNGTVKFTGKVFKETMQGSDSVSDGVRIKAYKRTSLSAEATELYNQLFTDPFELYFNGCDIAVTSGEIYYFAVDQNGTSSSDTTKVWLKVTFTQSVENPGQEATGSILPQNNENPEDCIFNQYLHYAMGAQSEYYTAPIEQGGGNLFVLYGKADGVYNEMTPDSSGDTGEGGAFIGNHWIGGAQYNNIHWRQEFSPDGGKDAIVAWRAPFNGKVKFTGKVFKESMGESDGVRIKAYNRKSITAAATELYNHVFTDPFTIYFNGCEIDVVSGEIYFFAVDQYETSAYDTTKVWLKAEFTQSEDDPGQESTGGILPSNTEDPASSIFNQYLHYPMGQQSDYYGVPAAQGENNAYALYGKADGLYYKMTSNPGSDNEGDHWVGGAQYNNIDWRQDFSPDGGNDAIVAWKAPFNGTVKFTGKVYKESMENSDGVRIKAYDRKSLDSEPEEIFNELYTDPFEIYFNGCDIEVVSGEIYYFAVDQNGTSAYDSTKVWLKIEFTKNNETPGTAADDDIGALDSDYTAYFSETQGTNNWFYAQGSVEKYALMTYGVSKNSGELCYNGVDDWQRISAGNMAPGTKHASLRIYVVPKDGVISVKGMLTKTSAGGDGMNAKIYLRGEAVFEHAFGAEESSVALPGTLRDLTVSAGDLVIFYTDCGGNGDNSYDNCTFACDIFTESESGEEIDPLDFISPVSVLELQGINTPDTAPDENDDYDDNNGGNNDDAKDDGKKNNTWKIAVAASAAGVGGAGIITAIVLILKKRRLG